MNKKTNNKKQIRASVNNAGMAPSNVVPHQQIMANKLFAPHMKQYNSQMSGGGCSGGVCGAKTRNGKKCKNRCVKNKKCHLHR